MHITELRLYDFRQFRSSGTRPGLDVRFHAGLNALVGENDSGKSTVIDAIKLVLLTQSGEYIRPAQEDFNVRDDGTYAPEFRIECVIGGLDDNEAKNFIEYLSFASEEDKVSYELRLYYRARRNGSRIIHDLLVGSLDDGRRLDGNARGLLRTVYLRPLRDAEREMSAGRRSRLSQILLGHPAFEDEKGHELVKIFERANRDIGVYFSEDEQGKEVLSSIRANLDAFHGPDDHRDAAIVASDVNLRSALEQLSLDVSDASPGLGELNLLFIAAELLLMGNDMEGALKTALVEEVEAHLHPQAQLRLVNYLQNEYDEHGAQVIITTHSPTLASKVNLKNLILMKGHQAYDLAEGRTMLEKGDYLFLQRFLDETKANLFFARGVLMVEGDAENILLPAVADIIGYPLESHGVSIVNVRGTAFLRYSRIFARSDGSTMGIPVSVVTDCDVKPNVTEEGGFDERIDDSQKKAKEKESYLSLGAVRAFVSPRWTLEYCVAMSCLSDRLHRSINYGKKILNSDGNPLDLAKIEEADAKTESESRGFAGLSSAERASRIYSLMLRSDGSSRGLKAIAAQCLAAMLRWEICEGSEDTGLERMFDADLYQKEVSEKKRQELAGKIENDPSLAYLVSAIKYAAGRSPEQGAPSD